MNDKSSMDRMSKQLGRIAKNMNYKNTVTWHKKAEVLAIFNEERGYVEFNSLWNIFKIRIHIYDPFLLM